jgi:uncharacterized protein (TIGR03790 family)
LKTPIEFMMIVLLCILCCGTALSLEPNEIVIIANSEVHASLSIAQYYCEKRGVPIDNIVAWPLGHVSRTIISREDYERRLAGPLRSRLTGRQFDGKVKCLLTTYGVPIMVGARGQLEGKESDLKQLEKLIEQEKKKLETPEQNEPPENKKIIETKIARLQYQINLITGRETNASVDSELSMVLFENYELYRWQPNRLMTGYGYTDINTLMVCRLDGPSEDIIRGLIDKSISTEKTGLHGNAYIDSRGIQNQKDMYGIYDQSLLDMALLTEVKTDLTVKKEQTSELFAPGSCPQTAIYCGWYSLSKYIDAFDFVDGAVGFHIASFEAFALRDPNSSQWCPAMLKDGIAATLGAVSEPYLHAFPRPRDFFGQLYDGNCLVEAYYRTNPFNSWQLLLVGDPLYRPFRKNLETAN